MPDIITRTLLESKGIPTRDIVAAIWGRKLSGGYEPAEATGTLPLTFRSNGTAILDYRIYGSTLTKKLNLWEWGNTNYRIDLTTPIAANTTLTYAVFKDGIADRAEGIYLYDVNGTRILNTLCANSNGSRIYATVTPTRDVHRIELSPIAADDALRMLIEGDTPPDEYISPEITEVQGVGVRTENLFDPNAAEISGNSMTSDFMPLDPSELVLTMAFDIPLRASYKYDVTYYDSTKTAISFVGGIGEAYKTREIVKLNRQSEAPNAAYVKVTLPKDLSNVLIQNGSTSGKYIPYGYKLPMVSRGENSRIETPIYIGSEPLRRIAKHGDYVDYTSGKIVRRIKKLVLTGKEVWTTEVAAGYGRMFKTKVLPLDDSRSWVIVRSTHYSTNKLILSWGGDRALFIVDDRFGNSISDFKSWLVAQYAAGTPVTVYYVLKTPIEEDPPVSLPALPTFSGADTVLDYEETPAPEEVWVKYLKKKGD